MATATFVHEGKYIDYKPTADVSAGDVIVWDKLIGIAIGDIEAGELGAVATEGVFWLPKQTGTGAALPMGSQAIWSKPDGYLQVAFGMDSQSVGVVVADADDDDTVALVKINV